MSERRGEREESVREEKEKERGEGKERPCVVYFAASVHLRSVEVFGA